VNIGELVFIDLPIDSTRGIFVPTDAVVRGYGKFYLWVVSNSQVLEAREVTLGPVYQSLVQIREGLRLEEHHPRHRSGRERDDSFIHGFFSAR